MKAIVRPLTPDLWPAFEDLFRAGGPVSRCWCMYWRLGDGYRKRPPEENQAAFCALVTAGPPPGLLALAGDLAVGWCQLTPRDALPWLGHTWRLKPVDAAPVWSISCFYIRKGYRKQGVTAVLVAAAIEAARRAGAPALEAYPLDAARTSSASHTGFVSTFARAGFTVGARRAPERPIMRYEFRAPEPVIAAAGSQPGPPDA